MTTLPFSVTQNINGFYAGYCKVCKENFKKDDYYLLLEQAKINKITIIKLCPTCFLTPLATKIGWKKVEELLIKICEEKI